MAAQNALVPNADQLSPVPVNVRGLQRRRAGDFTDLCTVLCRGAGSKLKVGGGAQMEKKIFCAPPLFCRAPSPALHTPGWAQRWAVIAHCLFVKKWPVAETETKIQ